MLIKNEIIFILEIISKIMMQHAKDEYLKVKVRPFDVINLKTVEDLLNKLKYCGFQGRNLGIALDILYEMFTNDKCLVVMSLSGAMVPAGMGKLITLLMKHKLIDVLVSTGANLSHDLVDVFTNIGHYLGSPNVNDGDLYDRKINRIYDIFLPEANYNKTEAYLLEIIKKAFPSKIIETSPSEFLKIIGMHIQKECILSEAAKNDIPIFVPGFSDSEMALDLIKFSEKENFKFKFDIFEDVKNFAKIIKKYELSGTFIIGGGVPRNWAQQIFPYLDNLEKLRDKGLNTGYNYSVRIHTATELDGGLSGCTIKESESWGKYAKNSKHVSVWCEATIALPILVTGVLQKLKII